jgi:hypothetical protein
MPDQPKSVRRFLRRLYRSVFHVVPNDGIREVDLSQLRVIDQNEHFPEFHFDWLPADKSNHRPDRNKST